MQMTQLIGKLGRSDVKLIGRDSFLIFMFLFAAIIATVLRFGLPALNTYLAENGVMPGETIPLSLADIYPMLVAFLAIYTGALLVGTVFGFVLLDERDHNTLKAMLVTPVPLKQYVLYRVGGPAILAFVIILGMALFINQALLPLWQMILISAGGALAAPIAALFFATFAENKVQGFAYSKFGGISGWAFLIGWFVPEPWQWLIGLFPPFWIGKAYWLALEGNGWWWLALIAGIVLQGGLINWLIQRFNNVAYRQ
jgi:fluoroquinolone transport system permease protein